MTWIHATVLLRRRDSGPQLFAATARARLPRGPAPPRRASSRRSSYRRAARGWCSSARALTSPMDVGRDGRPEPGPRPLIGRDRDERRRLASASQRALAAAGGMFQSRSRGALFPASDATPCTCTCTRTRTAINNSIPVLPDPCFLRCCVLLYFAVFCSSGCGRQWPAAWSTIMLSRTVNSPRAGLSAHQVARRRRGFERHIPRRFPPDSSTTNGGHSVISGSV